MSTCMLKGDGRRRGQLLLEGLTLWGIGWQGLDVVDRTWGTVVISGHQWSSVVISGHQRRRTLIHDRLEVLIRGTSEDPHDLLELISWVRPCGEEGRAPW
jgi:hypothetical protein